MMVLTRLVPALTRLADAETLLASVTVVFDPKVARGPYTAVDQASQVARSPTLKREMQASSRHLAVRVRNATIKSRRARKRAYGPTEQRTRRPDERVTKAPGVR